MTEEQIKSVSEMANNSGKAILLTLALSGASSELIRLVIMNLVFHLMNEDFARTKVELESAFRFFENIHEPAKGVH